MKDFIIQFPKSGSRSEKIEIRIARTLTIVGANGAGKSRLGTWIERNSKVDVHRISAQKSLQFNAKVKPLALAEAEATLFGGSASGVKEQNKWVYRWQRKAETALLSDYESLLITLFSLSAARDEKYTQAAKTTKEYSKVPPSAIDIIEEIWAKLLPHRKIEFKNHSVIVTSPSGKQYNGTEMSDGEKVVLYLIAQCLCAPPNSVIVIDEAENHIHKSLRSRLWSEIEILRDDLKIIYITHDLEFAANRKNSEIIWVEKFDGESTWTWQFVEPSEEFPTSLTLEVLGSRQAILFCEGETTSQDYLFYKAIYPNFHVIPRGSCQKVIESVKGLAANPHLHHIKAYGIIDYDYRGAAEVEKLRSQNIHALNVAEIENLTCIEPLVRVVASEQNLDPEKTFEEIKEFIIEELKKELDTQVALRAEREIKIRLSRFKKDGTTSDSLIDAYNNTISSIDPTVIIAEARRIFEDAINTKDYEQILRIYNRKSLPRRISTKIGLKDGSYTDYLVRMMTKEEKKEKIVKALEAFAPKLEAV